VAEQLLRAAVSPDVEHGDGVARLLLSELIDQIAYQLYMKNIFQRDGLGSFTAGLFLCGARGGSVGSGPPP